MNLKARIHYYFRLLEYCLAEILATFITVMLITSIANYYIFINHKMEVERKRDTQTLIYRYTHIELSLQNNARA